MELRVVSAPVAKRRRREARRRGDSRKAAAAATAGGGAALGRTGSKLSLRRTGSRLSPQRHRSIGGGDDRSLSSARSASSRVSLSVSSRAGGRGRGRRRKKRGDRSCAEEGAAAVRASGEGGATPPSTHWGLRSLLRGDPARPSSAPQETKPGEEKDESRPGGDGVPAEIFAENLEGDGGVMGAVRDTIRRLEEREAEARRKHSLMNRPTEVASSEYGRVGGGAGAFLCGCVGR